MFQVDYQDGDQLQPFTAQLNFLMISCRPCDFRHSSSKLQVLSAHSGYIVVLFQATYAGTFNLHLQDGDNTPQSFVFDVEQHVRVDVLGPLRAMTHHDSDHLDISSEFAREACGSSSCAHGTLAASTAFDGRSRAVATMISTDSYVTGALVLLWGILNYGNVGASHLICLVTESVSASSRKRLEVAGWEIFSRFCNREQQQRHRRRKMAAAVHQVASFFPRELHSSNVSRLRHRRKRQFGQRVALRRSVVRGS